MHPLGAVVRSNWPDAVRLSLATCLLVSIICAQKARGEHSVFAYKADYFEIQGGPFGFVSDDFNDGVVDPDWIKLFGTVQEANGLLTLSSPGTHDDLVQPLLPITLDRSDVISDGSGRFAVNAASSFVGTSRWEAILPDPPFGIYGMLLHWHIRGWKSEFLGVHIANLSPAAAALINVPAGLILTQGYGIIDADPVSPMYTRWVALEETGVSISPSDVTGQIAFRIEFDDTAGEITTSASLDGGLTFPYTFALLDAADFELAPVSEFVLSADPIILDPPAVPSLPGPAAWLFTALLAAVLGVSSARFTPGRTGR